MPSTVAVEVPDDAAGGVRRRRAARAGPGQPARQRAALQPRRRAARSSRPASTADRVELRVVDRGPGVPEEQREHVFAPFQRLGDRDNATGVGLGLALSRGLTEAMGGTLSAEDTPGGGLTMTRHACPVGGGRTRDAASWWSTTSRRSCGRWWSTCAPAGTTCTRPATAPSALRVAGQHPPDLVVLDLGLPDMEGTEVIAGLRGWTTAPIIVLTGRTEQLAEDRGAGRRRRRLRDQAVRDRGAVRPDARGLAARHRAARAERAGSGSGSSTWRPTGSGPRRATGEDQKLTPTEWRSWRSWCATRAA